MSLDPHWYSTMFGVVYIANSFVGSTRCLIIAVYLLQKFGYLRQSITRDIFTIWASTSSDSRSSMGMSSSRNTC